jgi:arsenite methyltransferase
MNEEPVNVVEAVRERYGAVARRATGTATKDENLEPACCGTSCCGDEGDAKAIALELGYSPEEVATAGEGNLGLGCGNPLALAAIRPGMTVLDLGSGAGFDAFLAAERVGADGRVVGVDMTEEMLVLARKNAAARGTTNVEFRAGRLEALPVEDGSVDLVISNCVINLVPDKARVFAEIARVLKPGGTISLSDLVLLAPLPASVQADVEAYVGCIAGAAPLGEYPAHLLAAGFTDVAIPHLRSAGDMVAGLGGSLPAGDVTTAARALASAVFHATKPARPAKPANQAG